MGFFYRPAGGGGGNDLTVPTGSVTLDADTTTYSVNLVNTGTTPASVELSFQNSRMKGLSPDSGTEASPTYVVDPDAGSRSITIKRDVVSGSSQAERVTFTSNQGNTQFLDFTLSPLNLHQGVRVLANKDPFYEFKFAGNFTDTGSRDFGDLSTNGSPTATSDSSDRTGLVGYVDMTVNQSAFMNASSIDINITSSPRTWIWTGKVNGTFSGNGVGHGIANSGAFTGGPFFLQYRGAETIKWRNGSGWGTDPLYYGTSHSHTDGGASVEMSYAVNTEILIAYVHDGSNTITVRWKTLNGNTERTGHSFASATQSAKSPINTPQIVGWPFTSNFPMRHGHVSVVDYELTSSEFTSLSETVGM